VADISSWDSSKPSGNSKFKDSDDQLRAHWGVINEVWEEEHYMTSGTSSAASGGVHRLGSARPYVGAESAISVAADPGRVMVTTDSNKVWNIGSSGGIFPIAPPAGFAPMMLGTGTNDSNRTLQSANTNWQWMVISIRTLLDRYVVEAQDWPLWDRTGSNFVFGAPPVTTFSRESLAGFGSEGSAQLMELWIARSTTTQLRIAGSLITTGFNGIKRVVGADIGNDDYVHIISVGTIAQSIAS
jgi:hypothetical protein